jgi:hypothetical protein
VIVIDCAAGGAPRHVENVRAVDDTASVLKPTASVTGIVTGLLLAPADVTVIVPLYVPAANPAVITDTDVPPGVVPLPLLNVSQFPPELVVAVAV